MEKLDFLFTRNRCRAEAGNKQDVELIKTLSGKGFSVGMVSSCNRIHSELKKENIFSKQMAKELKVSKKTGEIREKAERIEKEYGIPSLKRFVFPERCYYGQDYNYLLRKTVACFEWIEKFFDETEVKCLINSQGAQVDIRAFYFIAKKRGIPIIYLGESMFPDKILLFADEMKNLCNFKNIKWEDMSSKEKEEIEEHIKKFTSRSEVYIHSLMSGKKDEIQRSHLALKEYTKNGQFNEFKIVIMKKAKELIVKRVNKIFSGFMYKKDLGNCDFVYFPLHIADDSQITLRNPQFYDQGVLALHVARSLPFGYKLYIKEHPGNLLSIRDKINFLKEKNIVLLHPKFNSHEVIKKAKAITIINSTVGFEAYYYFKPVVVMGNWHLKGDGISIDGKDLFKLDETIKQAVDYKVDENKIKSFLFSLKKSMYEGNVMTPNTDCEKVADTIIKRYGEINQNR